MRIPQARERTNLAGFTLSEANMWRYRCSDCGQVMDFGYKPDRQPLCPMGCLHFMRYEPVTLTMRVIESEVLPQRLRSLAAMMAGNRGARF
jgi:hypothetical protein